MHFLLLLVASAFSSNFAFAQSGSTDAFVDLSSGYNVICGLRADGSVECSTTATHTQFDIPENFPALSQIESGGSHSCGVDLEGGIRCWGDADYGQLNAPTDITNFVSVSVGTGFHSCGVTDENQIICWGLDTNGQASPPNDGFGYTDVFVEYQSTCGLRTDGEIECWGGEDPNDPSRFFGNGPYSNYVVENRYSRAGQCALLTDGTLVCGNQRSTILTDVYSDVAFIYPYICGLQLSGALECNKEVNVNSSIDLENIEGSYTKMSLTGGQLCLLSLEGEISCVGFLNNSLTPPGTERVLPSPIGVSVTAYSDTAAEVSWERIAGVGFNVISGYEVFRNEELVAVVEGNSYFDDSLIAGVDYSYTVQATSFDGARSNMSQPVLVNTSERDGVSTGVGTYTVPNRPAEPTSADAYVYSDDLLELVWNRPASNLAIGYEVRRNNVYLGFTQGVSYVDNTITAGQCYRYNILPVDSDGHILGLLNIVASTGSGEGCE